MSPKTNRSEVEREGERKAVGSEGDLERMVVRKSVEKVSEVMECVMSPLADAHGLHVRYGRTDGDRQREEGISHCWALFLGLHSAGHIPRAREYSTGAHHITC